MEIEELKRKTRCHKCQQVGHWSRECKQAAKGKGKGSKSGSSSKGSDSGVALVEQFSETFVATVADEKFSGLSMLQWLRSRRATKV